jgi:hypothetical protein
MSNKLYGKYRAQVVKIDDPELRGRVLVKSPKILNGHELGWAESCFPPGMFSLPRKLDWVWIEFEEGDVNKPIWTGIMPIRPYVKEYLFRSFGDRKNYDPKIKLWVTDNHQMRFHDGDKKGDNKTITTTGGNSVILDQKGQVLKVVGNTLSNSTYWTKDDIGSY